MLLSDIRATVFAILFCFSSCLQDISYGSTYHVCAQGRNKGEGRKHTLPQSSQSFPMCACPEYVMWLPLVARLCEEVSVSLGTEFIAALNQGAFSKEGGRGYSVSHEQCLPSTGNRILLHCRVEFLVWAQWQSSALIKWLLLRHFYKPLSSLKINAEKKESYCLEDLSGLCGNLRISLKGLRKKAQLIMCLKRNTQQALTAMLSEVQCSAFLSRSRTSAASFESAIFPLGWPEDGTSCFI